jgi:polar amino acid transport system substrate-binding protein
LKFFVLFIIFFGTLFADSSILSKEEKEWIKNNSMKVGVTDLYPLSFLNKDYERDGFAIDVLELIIKKFQIKTKTVDLNQGNIGFAFENGEIDVVPVVNNSRIKNNYGVYSSEILQIKKILFVKKEQNDIHSLQDLKDKKVAIITEEDETFKLKNKDYEIKIIQTESIQESVEKLLEGSVDAFIASPIIIQKYLEDNLIIDLKAMPLINFEPSNLSFFINKEKTNLQSILEKGLNSISVKEEKVLFDKWFLKDLAILPLKLTKKELNYLKNKVSINMCVDPDWMPYEKIENHKHVGIVADYMKDFQKKIGIPINLVETKDWTQSLEYVRNRKCDILSLVMDTEKRRKYMNFTNQKNLICKKRTK